MIPPNAPTIEIRPARPAEAEQLTRVAFASKRHWRYSEALMTLWAASLTVTPQRIEQDLVYVATLADRIVGFYALIPTERPEVYELDDLWVLPESIGHGIGKRLFQHAISTVLEEGGAVLRLVAEPHAIGFYQKMGMTKIGERASKPAGRVLDVMALNLTRA
ncbi:MAG: GNAT family N-acetyltransferase [Caldilineaceae bacterium]